MTKDEAAQKFVDMLTDQQCREMLAKLYSSSSCPACSTRLSV